jgi:aspartate/methionine/tyrosine aminotransferase/ectoine hydroxylase-related dioxygenase (phytanoyl-CoA dioxygenase family)
MNLEEYFASLHRTDLLSVNRDLGSEWLSQEQIEQYKTDGILIVNGVFDDNAIAAATTACDRLDSLVAEADRSCADFNLEAPCGGWNGQLGNKDSYPGQIRRVKNLIDHGVAFRQIAIDGRLLRIIESLLGVNFSLHSKGFLMNKPPNVSTEKPWHQDNAYFPCDSEIVTAWIPLEDVDEENACLFGLPGSHRLGAMRHVGAELQLDTQQIDLTTARPYPMKRGSVILMDKFTVHCSGTNKTQVHRRALIFRYEKRVSLGDHLSVGLNGDVAKNGFGLETLSWMLKRVRNALEGLNTEPKTPVLGDIYNECEQIRRIVGRLFSGVSSDIGGGISPELRRGEQTSSIEKRHLILNRVLRDRAKTQNIEYFDMGTDYFYPFYSEYEPTRQALKALQLHSSEAMHYPSSYGLKGLRSAFQQFMAEQFGVALDRDKEIMINTGASQMFDALSRSFEGQYVLLPSLSLPTVSVIARGNGAEILRLPVHGPNGLIDLSGAQREVDRLSKPTFRFMYLNSPANPTGQVASLEYLGDVVEFAKRNGILVLHDMDSWFTHHSPEGRLHNILEIDGARDYCVTVLSLSKEFGLSGLRVGLIAGNSKIINTIRVHNSTFAVMIPEICQHAAEAALTTFNEGGWNYGIKEYITSVMRRTIDGWRGLGWPENAIHPPIGGFKYLVAVPPNIRSQGDFSAVELFDYYVASRANVKLSTSRSFNPSDDRFIRMVLMQNNAQIAEVFARLKSVGVSYQMDLFPGLAAEYAAFIERHAQSDF